MRPEPHSAPNSARHVLAVSLTVLTAILGGCASPADWDGPAPVGPPPGGPPGDGLAYHHGRLVIPAAARPRSGFRLLAPHPVALAVLPAEPVPAGAVVPVVYEDSNDQPDTDPAEKAPPPAADASTAHPAGLPIGPVGQETLTADEARCQAALRTAPVTMIALEQKLVREKAEKYKCLMSDKVVSFTQQLLTLRAAIRGNEAAENALKLFNGLAEAERQLGSIDQSLAEVARMQSDLERLQERGFDTPVDEGEFERQRFELLERRRQTVGQMAAAWARLAALIGKPATCELPPWHFALDIHAPTPCPPAEEAVGLALMARPELRIYRLVLDNLDEDLVEAAVSLMQQVEQSVGTADGLDLFQKLTKSLFFLKPLAKLCPGSDLEIRKKQLTTLLAWREEAVAGAVYAALADMAAAADRWHLADRRVASWQGTIDRLEKRREVDEKVTVFDVGQARLGMIQAESERLTAYFEWRAALVDLWTAQGIAAAGCGLPYHGLYWCQSCQTMHGIPGPEISEIAPEPEPLTPEPAAPDEGQKDERRNTPMPPAPAEPAPQMIEVGPDLRVTPTQALAPAAPPSAPPIRRATPIPQFITAPPPAGSLDGSPKSAPAKGLQSLGTCRPVATLRRASAR